MTAKRERRIGKTFLKHDQRPKTVNRLFTIQQEIAGTFASSETQLATNRERSPAGSTIHGRAWSAATLHLPVNRWNQPHITKRKPISTVAMELLQIKRMSKAHFFLLIALSSPTVRSQWLARSPTNLPGVLLHDQHAALARAHGTQGGCFSVWHSLFDLAGGNHCHNSVFFDGEQPRTWHVTGRQPVKRSL